MGVIALAGSERAQAQAKRYRIIDIGPIGTELADLGIAPTPFQTRIRLALNTLGISDRGMVVGGFATTEGPVHAFLWDASSALSAPVFTDLHVEAFGSEDALSSFADDVSDAPANASQPVFIVGQYGETLNVDAKAHAWRWSSTVTEHSLHTTAGPFSAAYSVTDSSPATIVGETTRLCQSEEPDVQPYRVEGFTGTSTPASMTLLDVTPRRTEGFARAVAEGASTSASVGGETGDQEDGDHCLEGISTLSCPYPHLSANRWLESGTSDEILNSLDPDVTGAFALGLNVSLDAAGLAWIVDTESSCFELPVVWTESETMTAPIVLDYPILGEPDAAQAEAISDRSDVTGCAWVVGTDNEAKEGVVWYGSPATGTFCVGIAVNEETLPCDDPTFLVRAAHDVNKYGHVAVILEEFGTDPVMFHAGALTHVADIDGDRRVDGTDFGILLSAWCSTCSAGALASADFDCDGHVDGDDQGVLLSAWSGSDFVFVDPLCECGEAPSFAGPSDPATGDDVAAAAETLGFGSLDELAAWAAEATEAQVAAVGAALFTLLVSGEEE